MSQSRTRTERILLCGASLVGFVVPILVFVGGIYTGLTLMVAQAVGRDYAPIVIGLFLLSFTAACWRGSWGLMRKAFEQGTPSLHVFAEKGDRAAAEAQLAAGADPNSRDAHDNTALHFAAYAGDLKVVSALLAAGVDKDARNREGQTALYLAAARRHAEIVSTLLAAGTARDGADALLSASGEDVVILAGETEIFPLPGGAKLEMVFLPAGTFWMGSPEGEPGWAAHQVRHQVTLTKGFQIGKYPVTQAQWQAVYSWGAIEPLIRMRNSPSKFRTCGGDCPVEEVSWNDCQEFIKRLNKRVPGGGFRLPTEAEWEYACRAGTEESRYGDLAEIAWYKDNSGGAPHPVGQKRPNAWGLYDMLGNVNEWCSDLARSYGHGGVFCIDPKGPSTSPVGAILRGGSWGMPASNLRAATRFQSDRNARNADPAGLARMYMSFGFRIARTPPNSAQREAGASVAVSSVSLGPAGVPAASAPPKARLGANSQLDVLRTLVGQMGVSEMWLSQIFGRGLHSFNGAPAGCGLVDYPDAVRGLARRGEVEIIGIENRRYREFYGEAFDEDIRFRVRALTR
jgi:formylglycine-generating enzyme required for sulfatase activity